MKNKEIISKEAIIITSGGRTGTAFFKSFFEQTDKNIIAFHEPESISSIDSKSFFWIAKKFGFLNVSIKKMMGKWGITNISNKRIYGEISNKEAQKQLLKERKKFIESFNEDLYVESSYHYYGLLDVIPEVFKNVRILYITRNGKDWVRSWMRRKGFYYKNSYHTIFNTRLHPKHNDPYFKKWKYMSRFERLCWAWQKINSYALDTSYNENVRLVKFEDIFNSTNRLKESIDFLLSFNDTAINKDIYEVNTNKKINQYKFFDFPKWEEWPQEYKETFKEICGTTMTRLGYNI